MNVTFTSTSSGERVKQNPSCDRRESDAEMVPKALSFSRCHSHCRYAVAPKAERLQTDLPGFRTARIRRH